MSELIPTHTCLYIFSRSNKRRWSSKRPSGTRYRRGAECHRGICECTWYVLLNRWTCTCTANSQRRGSEICAVSSFTSSPSSPQACVRRIKSLVFLLLQSQERSIHIPGVILWMRRRIWTREHKCRSFILQSRAMGRRCAILFFYQWRRSRWENKAWEIFHFMLINKKQTHYLTQRISSRDQIKQINWFTWVSITCLCLHISLLVMYGCVGNDR